MEDQGIEVPDGEPTNTSTLTETSMELQYPHVKESLQQGGTILSI